MKAKSLYFKTIFIILMILCLFMSVIINYNYVFAVDYNSSSSEIVMDVNTNRVLYSKNADDKKFMASTTKILTAIVIIESSNIDDQVEITGKTIGIEGSSIYLEKGEILTVKDLLYGLMLRSGNDCAETLAVYKSGSIDDFAELMNNKAKEIGANNSHFVNPHGLHDDNHYTTAYDLALISCYAMKNPIFKEIVSTKKTIIPFSTKNTKRVLINKNKMLSEFDGATGIKTGFTKKAGRCLVSSCFRDGMELVSVVLNCPPMFERSKELLNDAFNKYSTYKLVESDDVVDFVAVENSIEKCPIYLKNDLILPLSDYEKNNYTIEYEIPEVLLLPIKKDEEIGKIKITVKNNLIYTEKLYTMIDI